MKCQINTGGCKSELKLFENGDVLEFCTICDFKHLHESKNIRNSELNPNNKKDQFFMFCESCGGKLINGDCSNCYTNSAALREFEEEDD